jgi:hypothetical protein
MGKNHMQQFTIQTRSGEVTFESSMTDQEAINVITGVQKPGDFALDLARAFFSNKYSPKQRAWMHKLAMDALAPKSEKVTVQVGEFSKLAALFVHASKTGKLKNPAIHLEVDGNPLKIYLAGDKSRNAGCLGVTDGGGYGNGKWYGWVKKDGSFEPGSLAPEWVAEFLKVFAADPARIAHEYGARTGRCCFCNTKLTDRSADAGFGDTCAKSYGLFEEWKHYTGNGRLAGKAPVNIPVSGPAATMANWARK